MDWDNFYMSMVFLVAMKSRDNSSKVGTVIVGSDNELLSIGYNGLPRGFSYDNPERHERPLKYSLYEHSERNSIFNCARIGVSTKGAKCYTSGIPCADCARALINSGISEVIVYKKWNDKDCSVGNRKKWADSAVISKEMFDECGVKVRYYDGPITTQIKALSAGQEFSLKMDNIFQDYKHNEWYRNATKQLILDLKRLSDAEYQLKYRDSLATYGTRRSMIKLFEKSKYSPLNIPYNEYINKKIN